MSRISRGDGRARDVALRARWSSETATACAGTDLRADLGYLATCAAPPSACTFATPTVDAPGPENDLLDCLCCRIEESLSAAGIKLFANEPVRNACHEAVGRRGLAFLKRPLRELKTCQEGAQASIAASLSQPRRAAELGQLVADWRASSLAACAGTNHIDSPPG